MSALVPGAAEIKKDAEVKNIQQFCLNDGLLLRSQSEPRCPFSLFFFRQWTIDSLSVIFECDWTSKKHFMDFSLLSEVSTQWIWKTVLTASSDFIWSIAIGQITNQNEVFCLFFLRPSLPSGLSLVFIFPENLSVYVFRIIIGLY